MVDSADRERMVEAREELFSILESDEMRGVPVVVIANKQDLPGKGRVHSNLKPQSVLSPPLKGHLELAVTYYSFCKANI